MPQIRDWNEMKEMSARLLKELSGEDVAAWNRRIVDTGFSDERSLREWLTRRGVTGYAQSLLVMERFGYPDFFLSSADELIEGRYADRPALRPIFDALIEAASGLGEMVIQARKTYVSLLTPKRTFARIVPATRDRVDVGLRLDGEKAGGRLRPSKIQETMRLQISLAAPEEVDDELIFWLRKAFDENR